MLDKEILDKEILNKEKERRKGGKEERKKGEKEEIVTILAFRSMSRGHVH
jgi:hypothetical protein